MDMRFWRRWHRWVSWIAVIFLVWAATTGILVAAQEFWGPDEAERERLRDLVSDARADSPDTTWTAPIARALKTAAEKAPGAPVDKIEVKLKGDKPMVNVFIGKPKGGEDHILRIDAKTGALVAEDAYEDKPLLYRLHSGEAFGDGGLVVSMFWGFALVVLGVSGGLMYIHMYRKHQANQQPSGVRKFFW